METFDFGNGSMARVLEALQSLHLPRYCAPLAFDALFLASLMAGEGCTVFLPLQVSHILICPYAQFHCQSAEY